MLTPYPPSHTLLTPRALLLPQKAYWEDRYAKDANPFDWYGRYGHFKNIVEAHVKRGQNILVIGCGSSRLTEELYVAELTSIANIDFSDTVIKQMIERNSEKTSLTWQVMDVTLKLDFPDGSFDACIDKGCLDSILCGESSTNNVANAMYNILRVLKPDGVFILISHWSPDKWLGYLEVEAYNWTITSQAVPRPVVGVPAVDSSNTTESATYGDPIAVHFVYVCRKLAERAVR